MLTMTDRRNKVLDYMRSVKNSDWKTPAMEPELIDAILEGSLTVPFDINEGPFFGQIFRCKLSVRKDWVASAALFCWAGKHLCSGNNAMYTMAGLFSLPVLPEAWHLEFQPGHGLEDPVTICRLIPD